MMSERQRELRINRTIHWLRQGVPPEKIDPDRIGVTADEMPELIETAKRRIVENDKAYAKMTLKSSLGLMTFGIAMLALAFYLADSDVPPLRQGRLGLSFLLGGASFGWGLFRFFNHNPKYHFF
ncbi:MAG: hypothetical protein RLZZ444_2450 [Pseudomonadota bacterium]|jgi:hypothetical protein